MAYNKIHFVQNIFLFVISLSFSRDSGIMYISREWSGQEENKASFILHFKKVVIINVA